MTVRSSSLKSGIAFDIAEPLILVARLCDGPVRFLSNKLLTDVASVLVEGMLLFWELAGLEGEEMLPLLLVPLIRIF